MKVGICTGGGDCPGLNAAIRAVVRHGIGSFGFEMVGIHTGLTGLMGPNVHYTPLPLSKVTGILDRGGTILGTSNKGTPFTDEEATRKTRAALKLGWDTLKLDALVIIGGDGTQSMARQVIDMGYNVIGIPKTIDNDLMGTEQTIGFMTAVDIATEAAMRLQSTAESHDRIMVMEVMGRDSGYITLNAGIASGANVVLIPEIPFSYDAICRRIESRRSLGRNYSLVLVAEGASAIGGEASYTEAAGGKKNLGGIGAQVAHELHHRTGMETRVTVLGHVQRGGSPAPADRILATQFGVAAVDLIAAKKFNRMVVLRDGKVSSRPYSEIGEGRQQIPADHSTIRSAEAIGICLGRDTKFKLAR
jgi:6-phosphofructokinase 1